MKWNWTTTPRARTGTGLLYRGTEWGDLSNDGEGIWWRYGLGHAERRESDCLEGLCRVTVLVTV